jgi:hypothetical protein
VDADSNEKLPIMAEVPADLLAEVEADNAAYKCVGEYIVGFCKLNVLVAGF